MEQEFYNRKKELSELHSLYTRLDNGGKFVAIYGRRRVGKTELVRKFLSQLPHEKTTYAYINATNSSEKVVQDISDSIAKDTGDLVTFNTWSHFFSFLRKKADKDKYVIVLDEFQRLNKLSPEVITTLQKEWDISLKNKKLMIILVGSSMGMMHELVLGLSAPLYERLDLTMRVDPFDYVAFSEMFSFVKSEEEQIKLYSIFGGTPEYLRKVKNNYHSDIYHLLEQNLLNKSLYLFNAVSNLLSSETRNCDRYNAILEAIAMGKHTQSEIANYMSSSSKKYSSNDLNPYLEKLTKILCVLKKSEPVLNNKYVTRYVFADNFFQFWYNFVYNNQSAIEVGNCSALLEKIKFNLASYIGRRFENIVQQVLIALNGQELKGKKLDFTKMGSWWGVTEDEIDICAPGSKEIIISEVRNKTHPITVELPKKLIEIKLPLFIQNLPDSEKGKPIRMLLISRTGFTPGCKTYCSENEIECVHFSELIQLVANIRSSARSKQDHTTLRLDDFNKGVLM